MRNPSQTTSAADNLLRQYQLASDKTKRAFLKVWQMTKLVEVSPLGFGDPGVPRVGYLLSVALIELSNEHHQALNDAAEAGFGNRKTDLPPHNKTNIVVFPTAEERDARKQRSA